MFYVDSNYRTIKESNLYKTVEEATEAAEAEASKDFEGLYFYVSEVKALVRADIKPNPTKTLEVTVDTAHLLGESSGE